MTAREYRLADIPRSIWALGFVSMFMDVSSEMIHALLPLYLVNVLGASALAVGFIEGLAEATAMIAKIFSGALSDYLGKRKLLAVAGYGLAALTRPIFPLANGLGWLVTARFVDRVGKGIRGAPRDALVADIAPAHLRGAAYGLRQSLDTVGAFMGPLIAIGLMLWTADSYRIVFWMAVVPAFIAVALLVVGVEEPVRNATGPGPRWKFTDAGRLPASFWLVVGVSAILTLARFSEAFLVLRAQNAGLDVALVPAILVVMSIAYSLSSYPAGVLADRFGRIGVLTSGIAMLVISDLVLAFGPSIPVVLGGVVFWGLHMGLTQGVFAALVADTSQPELRGTAFGFFNLVGGLAMLGASLIAGALWDRFGPGGTFTAGAIFALLALAGLVAVQGRTSSTGGAAGADKRETEA